MLAIARYNCGMAGKSPSGISTAGTTQGRRRDDAGSALQTAWERYPEVLAALVDDAVLDNGNLTADQEDESILAANDYAFESEELWSHPELQDFAGEQLQRFKRNNGPKR